jgi:hypothetical protein
MMVLPRRRIRLRRSWNKAESARIGRVGCHSRQWRTAPACLHSTAPQLMAVSFQRFGVTCRRCRTKDA